MEPITYSLKSKNNSDFYKDLSVFTDKILTETNHFFIEDIHRFMQFIEVEGIAKLRNENEYIVEFVSLGIFFNKYSAFALNTSDWVSDSMHTLYKMRKSSDRMKPYIDSLRGFLSAHLLYVRTNNQIEYTSMSFAKLVKWLNATGEFKEEAARLTNWAFYFATLDSEQSSAILAKAASFAGYFEEQGRVYLGKYTENVNKFLSQEHKNYKYREDYLFAGRSEAEYHLNMFGAEVLNRVLKSGFEETENKVLLLPTCMSKPEKGTCRAKSEGLRMSCTQCSGTCEVASIVSDMKNKGVETFLIPHSSSFSKFLEYWQNQSNTGLIGVACVLNLLTGGYEMQRLNIRSQCVFLDHAGCKKHWHNTGVATSINLEQLSVVVANKKVSIKQNIDNLKLVKEESKVA